MWRPLAASKNMAITGLFVAPDNFVHEEENVATALLRNVYHELWLTIESKAYRLPIQDCRCNCQTGCSTNRCGCRRRENLCNYFCTCQTCMNTT
ncbi:hypothetical protein PF005_g32232 [Phytophthora fragariae]|uniref:CRC domain-containing protein n=2 Tax=Phytophthora TaxID=4783 RepID=A0A6A3PMD5_9STRA|nr:hypothetical protein PF009_g32228 [Phytophthora fragariae]KAE8957603.1 hypothetical protein PR001_g31314 [Phytophthora rubi]KAE8955939.1 hypothetical protein PF011_g31644 [Phytophthora fragariae]KAE9056166.1 hypothetical protein PF010_g31869 [Phytophthora fragariae]KAE9057232.1 hypothetical protein PF007_g31713 [Phytophthora fragariae]